MSTDCRMSQREQTAGNSSEGEETGNVITSSKPSNEIRRVQDSGKSALYLQVKGHILPNKLEEFSHK